MADEVEAVFDIVSGRSALRPRRPINPVAVDHAESILGVSTGAVYSFAGCLHPKLGPIGIIISAKCGYRLLQGATRCDSGGLAGQVGSFVHVSSGDVDSALLSLSTFPTGPSGWPTAFTNELDSSYSGPRAYIRGSVPESSHWKDVRAFCMRAHDLRDWPPDRRLWTWEVRLLGPPDSHDFIALVFSPEASKHVESLRLNGAVIPDHVKIIPGEIKPDGVHYFMDPIVQDLFCERVTQ
jgi:hypothetical protein